MPTNRRRYTRNRVATTRERDRWADWFAEFELHDHPLSPFGGDRAAMEDYWRDHGEAITTERDTL